MAANDAIASFDISGLERLTKALKVKAPETRVGILGESGREKKAGERSSPSNAEIGAAHELGTSTIPRRSFLRMPIAKQLNRELERSKHFTEDTLKEVIRTATIVPWMETVAICAEACVADAFDTGGGGEWPGWKNPNYENNTGDLLVDTHQLRDSILSDVAGSVKKRAGT